MKISLKKYGLPVLAIFIALMVPFLITQRYYLQVSINCLFIAMAVQALNLMMGYTGQNCQCHPAFYGIGGYVVAIATLAGWNFWLALLVGAIINVLIAYGIGLLTFRTSGAYFAVVSLCFSIIVYICLASAKEITGGYNGLTGIPKPQAVGPIDFSSRVSQYYLALFLLIITVLFIYRLVNSMQGLSFKSVRENEALAKSLGINVQRTKMIAFVTSAVIASVAGGVYSSFLSTVSPSTAHFHHFFQWLAYMILGGSGTLAGPIIGSVVLPVCMEFLQAIEQYKDIIYGLLVILCVIFAPNGLMGMINSRKEKKALNSTQKIVPTNTSE